MQHTSSAFTFALPLRRAVHYKGHIAQAGYSCAKRQRRASCRTQYHVNRTVACSSTPSVEKTRAVRIRRATRNDVDVASRVLASAFSEDFLIQESTPSPLLTMLLPLYEFVTRLEVLSQLKKRVKLEKHAILLAEINDKAVGCAEVGVLDVSTLTNGGDDVKKWGKGGSQAYVGNVGVLRRYRGQGVGRRLVSEAEGAAQNWGMGEVWLCVEARNDGAVRFYEKLGFGCVAQEPDWFDEVGKRRRLFLCSSKGMAVGKWGSAKKVGGKLGIVQYLRYCLYDLRRKGNNVSDGNNGGA